MSATISDEQLIQEAVIDADVGGWTHVDDFPRRIPAHIAGAALVRIATAAKKREPTSPPVISTSGRESSMPLVLPPSLEPAPDRHRSALVDWDELWTIDADADDWLIAPVIAAGRGHALFAPAKLGKSLLSLWLAASAATGRQFFDQPEGRKVRTLYLDLEMTREDIRERLADMGFGPSDDLSALAYYSLPSLAVLDSQLGGEEVLALAQAHDAELVIIDTMSRVIGGEENSADTLRSFFRWTGAPLKAAGIATVRIDHAGKDIGKGMRGSSAKADDVDIVWEMLARDRGRFDLKATHRRMGWVPQTLHLAQDADPLGYRLVDDVWPAGTEALVIILDTLKVPTEWGKVKVRIALKEAGEKAANDVLAAAIRWRKKRADGLVGLGGQAAS